MNRKPLIWAALLVASGAAIAVFWTLHREAPPRTLAERAALDRHRVDAVYKKPEAPAAYKRFIEKWKSSPDKKVQDEVGAARIRLAYLSAHDKDYKSAQALFHETAQEYKGTGSMSSDFGGIKDQALYQAAVCLSAEGKKAEARKALVDFIKAQPLSPLVHAAYKRIVKMDGEAKPEIDRLLQNASDAQQKQIRFETSVCGPKALAYLLKKLGKGDFDYKALARECGRTDQGSSIEGLRKALRAHGVESYGYELTVEDLRKTSLPAIVLIKDHYVVLERIDGDAAFAFDPRQDKEQQLTLPKADDPDALFTVLSLTFLDINTN